MGDFWEIVFEQLVCIRREKVRRLKIADFVVAHWSLTRSSDDTPLTGSMIPEVGGFDIVSTPHQLQSSPVGTSHPRPDLLPVLLGRTRGKQRRYFPRESLSSVFYIVPLAMSTRSLTRWSRGKVFTCVSDTVV